MDIKQLVTFAALEQEKSYIKVSERLNYAPSTLAKHIHSLEDELQTRLVEYRGGRIELTADGRKFMGYARELLDIYARLQEEFNRSQAIPGCIRVAGGELIFSRGSKSWEEASIFRSTPSAAPGFPSGWTSMRWILALSRC